MRLHVVAGAIVSGRSVLIARRAAHAHQGNLWEFPGGKVELGETPSEALTRELREELGITPVSAQPLIALPYEYPDRTVLLDVWHVPRFMGTVAPREGQPLVWVPVDRLNDYTFPAANRPAIAALRDRLRP